MKLRIILVAVCMAVFAAGAAIAEQKTGPAEAAATAIVQTVADGCKAEIDKYCKTVSPGEGRVLACLYAYEDKLSNQCEYALYDAASQLQMAVNTLSYAVNECRDDLKKFCSSIQPGQGRLLECLNKNSSGVSGRCKQALKDTKLK